VASESTQTGYNDTQFAAWVTSEILDEIRPYNVMRPFFRYAGRQASNVYDFPIQADPGLGDNSAVYTEGTGLSNTQLTTDKATATAGTFGVMATVTDELNETSLIDVGSQTAAVISRSVMEKFETDATALIDDFANTTGTDGVPTTLATLLEAVNQLEQRDQMGSPVGVLDPVQVGDVRQDAATSGAAILATGNANGTINATLAGYAFSYGGVDWHQTSLVTATGGAVFLRGVALGHYEVRPLRIETERDASLPGTEVVATTRYGLIEIRDVAGETILV
jgi:hypothetical protein